MAAPASDAVTASGCAMVGKVTTASTINETTTNIRSIKTDNTSCRTESANFRASHTRTTSPPTVPNGRLLKNMLA